MKICAFALTALFLTATGSAAQSAPPLTPVLPCDTNAIMGSPNVPPLSIATRSGAVGPTEQRQTTISVVSSRGAARYFVDGRESPIERLGRTAAEAWLNNSGGASIEQCWDGPAPGVYTIAGRQTSICRIVIVADGNVSYGRFSAARDALRDAGLTGFILVTPEQTRAVPDDHLPLNPVPIRLEGTSPTIVRIESPPDATEPVISISDGASWIGTSFAQLQANMLLAGAHNNPALTAEESMQIRVCVRPYSNVAYADVLRVLTSIRDAGFPRVGLYSQVVIATDAEGNRR